MCWLALQLAKYPLAVSQLATRILPDCTSCARGCVSKQLARNSRAARLSVSKINIYPELKKMNIISVVLQKNLHNNGFHVSVRQYLTVHSCRRTIRKRFVWWNKLLELDRVSYCEIIVIECAVPPQNAPSLSAKTTQTEKRHNVNLKYRSAY